jgi:hypothetical protein
MHIVVDHGGHLCIADDPIEPAKHDSQLPGLACGTNSGRREGVGVPRVRGLLGPRAEQQHPHGQLRGAPSQQIRKLRLSLFVPSLHLCVVRGCLCVHVWGVCVYVSMPLYGDHAGISPVPMSAKPM